MDALLETDEGAREFVKEELAFEATEKISELMELTGISKSELARRTGSSKAYITQLLSGSRNMTVHTLAGLAFALGYRITFNSIRITQAENLVCKPEPVSGLQMVRIDSPARRDSEEGRGKPSPLQVLQRFFFFSFYPPTAAQLA
ncbi:MAG: helix-turn-helix transcriptional regulator [Bryobacteraceae bacterium]